MKNNYLKLNKSSLVRVGLSKPEIQLCAGEGSTRKELSINSSKLIEILYSFTNETPLETVHTRVKESLKISLSDAQKIVDLLEENQILVSDTKTISDSAHANRWDEWGWRDALDYHLATRNMEWKHFPGITYEDAPIRTAYKGAPMVPDRERPQKRTAKNHWEEVRLPNRSEKLKNISYAEALYNRETFRNFSVKPVALQDFSDLLSLTSEPVPYGPPVYRPTPVQTYSLGNFYSLYPIVVNVENLNQGAYLYSNDDHSIRQISQGNYSDELVTIVQNQTFMSNVSFGIIVSVHWDQYMWKYRFPKAYRVALFEIAAVVQTLLIIAAGLGIKTFLTPAVNETKASQLCDITDLNIEKPMYAIGFGHK